MRHTPSGRPGHTTRRVSLTTVQLRGCPVTSADFFSDCYSLNATIGWFALAFRAYSEAHGSEIRLVAKQSTCDHSGRRGLLREPSLLAILMTRTRTDVGRSPGFSF